MDEKETIKKIQELVPEIMELNFGCKIIEEINGKDVISKIDNFYLSHSKDKRKNFNFAKILGRDISLEDTLLAIERKFGEDRYSCKIYTDIPDILKGWIFNRPFTEQDQKTKDFIGNLLLKSNI